MTRRVSSIVFARGERQFVRVRRRFRAETKEEEKSFHWLISRRPNATDKRRSWPGISSNGGSIRFLADISSLQVGWLDLLSVEW